MEDLEFGGRVQTIQTKEWNLEDECRQSKLKNCWERPDYWEESWRLEETCCHPDSSERLSANADMKNHEEVI